MKEQESKQSACGCLIERDGWDGFSILTLTYCPKHLAAPAMYEALRETIAELENAQGEWASVSETYAPEWTHLIKSAISRLEGALAQAEGKTP